MGVVPYDEDDDGFMFTRTRAKKAKAAQAIPEAIPEDEVAVTVTTNGKRKSAVSRAIVPAKQVVRPRRKSSRLASESAAITSNQRQDGAEDQPLNKSLVKVSAPQKRPDIPVAEAEEDPQLLATHNDTQKIALPFSDTPIIQRNKEFRQSGIKGHRRSSIGLRGRRASSLIENGSDGMGL